MSPMTSPAAATVICTAWKPFERNTLRGFADLWLRDVRLTLYGCPVHATDNGRRWVGLPARPQIDQNRELIKDDAGKIQYATVMEWDSREVTDSFNQAALKAIDNFCFKQDFSR